jgi:HSP20 family protein
MNAYPDDEFKNLQIEIILPGVEKESYYPKIIEHDFYIKATKKELTVQTITLSAVW